MTVESLIEALPPDFSLTLVDVGSAGGLNARWAPLGPIISAVLFDPRELEASGNFGRGATRTYPVALGEERGAATLNLTTMANMSSFLRHDPEVYARYGKKQQDAAVQSTEEVPIETLDELSSRDGFRVDVMKVDTQGSELMVLNGAKQALHAAVLAEVEVSFFRRYVDQPLFADVEHFMASRGFELIDLLKLKRYRSSNSLGIRNAGVPEGERSGKIAYADAIFLRSREDILSAAEADSGATLLKAVVALTAYGKADMAAQLVDEAGNCLDFGQADAIRKALNELARPNRSRGLFRRFLGNR